MAHMQTPPVQAKEIDPPETKLDKSVESRPGIQVTLL